MEINNIVDVLFVNVCAVFMCICSYSYSFSGCPSVQGFEGTHLVFMAAGNDPFDVITNAVKYICRSTTLIWFFYVL